MADKVTRNMSDRTPRDPSKMGSHRHTALYTVLVVGAAIVIGYLAYSATQGTHDAVDNPPATTTQ